MDTNKPHFVRRQPIVSDVYNQDNTIRHQVGDELEYSLNKEIEKITEMLPSESEIRNMLNTYGTDLSD